MRFDVLTAEEIRIRAKAGAVAVIPTGCIEQQGPHLPVGFDTWFAHDLCVAAAERALREQQIEAVVLPALPFGPTPEHRNYGSGFVDLPAHLQDAVVTAIMDSLAHQGFQWILVWRGCGGHDLTGPVSAFNQRHKDACEARLPAQPFQAIWSQMADPGVPGGHADSFTTSICLYLYPEHAHPDRIPGAAGLDVDWADPGLDFAQHSPSGVIGDPGHASAELGRRLWEASVDAVLSEIASFPGEPQL